MKSKGQTLIMFVILLPVIIGFMALVVDTGLMYKHYIKVKGVTVDAVDLLSKSKDIDKVKELYRSNKIEVNKLEIKMDPKYEINITSSIDSIFGKILGFNEYQVKVKIDK